MRLDSSAIRAAALPVIVAATVAFAGACGRADAAATIPASRTTPIASPIVSQALAASPALTLSDTRDTVTDSVLIAAADKGRLMGRDSGAIWLVVMSDFQCPYCKSWHDSTMTRLKRDFVDPGKVRLAFLSLPLAMHTNAHREAEASMCASAQRQFWAYSAALFRDQRRVASLSDPTAYLDGVARELALDMPEFTRCRKSQSIHALVEADIQQATKIGVRSTPSFLIGEFLVEGALPYADFRRAVDSALSVARSKRSR